MASPKLLAFLSDPSSYPHGPQSVQTVETHISHVFIAGDRVFKIKKPVNFGFLDFTTLEKREFYCREELRLNRRLAEDIYLGVLPIHEDEKGSLNWEGRGNVVEYAVWMKRIPEDRMLGSLLSKNEVEPEAMERIAARICGFHRDASTGGEIDEIGGYDTIRRNHEENFEQTEPYVGITIPSREYDFLRAWALGFLEARKSLFLKRVREHRIRECHGDLHLQHICLTDGIVIFDCIEFNKRFRYLDTAAEVAFLSMDLDFHGYGRFGRFFLDAYLRESEDGELPVLLPFYQCYFAFVRGKVTGFRLDDPKLAPADRKRIEEEARRYFRLAFSYGARLDRPTLIVMSGWMGTGKSLVARGLAPLLGAEVLRMDVLRKELLEIAPTDHRYEEFGKGIYGEEMNRRTYDEGLRRAKALLKEGKSVILDGSFRSGRDRAAAMEAASSLSAPFFLIYCFAPDEVLRRRLETRKQTGTDASDGRWELLESQKRSFDPVEGIPRESLVSLDTSGEIGEITDRALLRIRTGR
jgi:aminoglycoside phosphotransferase family enzyme/predicted kinase